jgi:hypothetical protein
MCCFATVLLFLGPRVAFLVYWLVPVGRVRVEAAFNTWIWPLLGLIFLPWTVLLYMLLYPVVGWEWVAVGFGLVADLGAYTGGFRNRRKVTG